MALTKQMSKVYEYHMTLAKRSVMTVPVDVKTGLPLIDVSSGTADWEIIDSWYGKWRKFNIAVCIGFYDFMDGLVVICCDGQSCFDDFKAYIHGKGLDEELFNSVPEGKSPSGEIYLFFRTCEIYHSAPVLNGVRVIGQDGYCVCGPSVDADGAEYKWTEGKEFKGKDPWIGDFPVLEDLILSCADDDHGKPIGQHNAYLIRHDMSSLDEIRKNGASQEDSDDTMYVLKDSDEYGILGYDQAYINQYGENEIIDILPNIVSVNEQAELIDITPDEIEPYELHAQEIKNLKTETVKGVERPVKGILSAKTLIQYDKGLYGRIRWNELSCAVYTTGGLPWSREDDTVCREWDTYDNLNLEAYLEAEYHFRDPGNIRKALILAARHYPYNPIWSVLKRCEALWDHKSRIGKILPKWLGADDNAYTAACMRHVMLSAIARVDQPGCKVDEYLALAGGQGIGKSTFVKEMALRPEWCLDRFDVFGDPKKTGEVLSSSWIVELAEMTAFNKADASAAKSFLTSTRDDYRPAYAKDTVHLARHCIFISTTNNLTFRDRTGNRRFLPVECHGDRIKVRIYDAKQEFRDEIIQAWGEAMYMYRASKGNPRLTLVRDLEEEANKLREDYVEEDPWASRIQEWLDTTDYDRVCVGMIWDKALGMEKTTPTRKQSNLIHELMRTDIHGWEQCGGKQRCGRTEEEQAKYGVSRCYERCDRKEHIAVAADKAEDTTE